MLKKRITAAAIAMYILAALCVTPARGASLSNLRPVRVYPGHFTDIAADSFYYNYIITGYEYGYFDGYAGGVFAPDAPVTVAEAVKLAVCVYSVYESGTADIENGDPWYDPYLNFAIERGIVNYDDFSAYDAPITRAEFALLISRAMPEEAYAAINEIPDGAIPDVPLKFSFADGVYRLYRAGVLTGTGEDGAFYPNRGIRRSEASALLSRAVMPETRVSFSLPEPSYTSEELYKLCSPAVFLIEILDGDGEIIRTGSGFFISPDGLAVTNCHVAANILSARVTTSNGTTYDISGIYDRDLGTDCALIQIDGSGFPYLQTRDSDTVVTGEEVCTIGSPLGFINTITRGIVSASSREINGTSYIQLDAAISHGSSGGVLLDSHGKVIGITSATVSSGQNFNLAMPINVILDLDDSKWVTFERFERALPYYYGSYPVPDFGIYSGEPLLLAEHFDNIYDYYYKMPLDYKRQELEAGYAELLTENGFFLYLEPNELNKMTVYANGMFGMTVLFGEKVYDGVRYWCLEIVM